MALLAVAAVAVAAAGAGTSPAAGAPAELRGPPRQVFADGGEAYLVDSLRGTVQWLDSRTMAPRGELLDLGGPIGRPVVDPAGVLWASVGDSGYVTGVFRDRRARPVKVSGEGQRLQLLLVTGRLVAFDHSTWTVHEVDPRGVRRAYGIPREMQDPIAAQVLLPQRTESSLIPMLGESRLIVVDHDQRWIWWNAHNVDDVSRLAEPQAYGRSIALTDVRAGELQRIDFPAPRRATSDDRNKKLAGGAGYRSILVRNGGLFVDEVHISKPR